MICSHGCLYLKNKSQHWLILLCFLQRKLIKIMYSQGVAIELFIELAKKFVWIFPLQHTETWTNFWPSQYIERVWVLYYYIKARWQWCWSYFKFEFLVRDIIKHYDGQCENKEFMCNMASNIRHKFIIVPIFVLFICICFNIFIHIIFYI